MVPDGGAGEVFAGREIRAGTPLARLRALCMALPATEERVSHGEPCWWAGGRKMCVVVDDAWRQVAPRRLDATNDAD